MEDTHFKMGFWGRSCDSVEHEGVQAIGNLENNRVMLTVPIGSLLGNPGRCVIGRETPPNETDYLYGVTQDGYSCVLVDAYSLGCWESSPGMESQKIRGKYLLAKKGGGFDPCSKIESVSLRLTGLREWFGESPFVMRLDEENTTFRSLELSSENAHQRAILHESSSYVIKVSHALGLPWLDVGNMTFSHDVVLTVDFSELVSFADAMVVANRIAQFFSLAQGFQADIERLDISFADCDRSVRCYSSRLPSVPPDSIQTWQIPLSYHAISGSVSHALEVWLDPNSGLAEAGSMVASLMTYDWTMPVDIMFTAASQALEALSKHDTVLESMPAEQFERMKGSLQSAISGLSVEEQAWMMSRVGSNRKGQDRLLREMLDRYGDYSLWLIPSKKAFISMHRSARNWYAHRHGGEAPISTDELVSHTSAVLLLAYGVLWMKLGIDANLLIERLKSSNYKGDAVRKCQKLY